MGMTGGGRVLAALVFFCSLFFPFFVGFGIRSRSCGGLVIDRYSRRDQSMWEEARGGDH